MKHSIKRIINQIVDLCLQKQIHCSINTEVFSISIHKGSMTRNSYYYGCLHNNKNALSGTTILLSDLLKFLKNY